MSRKNKKHKRDKAKQQAQAKAQKQETKQMTNKTDDHEKPHAPYKRCHEDHPVLSFGAGKFYGGACGHPIKDCDIYVALDEYSAPLNFPAMPWHAKNVQVNFPIKDMQAPSYSKEFKRMIDWLAAQLTAGKNVHVGCIGGHGRTGLVVAALAKVMLNETDAITWARTNYCKKAVETTAQVQFLHDQFGIKKVAGSKADFASRSFKSMGDYRPTGYREVSNEVMRDLWPDFHTAKAGEDWRLPPELEPRALPDKTTKRKASGIETVKPRSFIGNVWGLTDNSGIVRSA